MIKSNQSKFQILKTWLGGSLLLFTSLSVYANSPIRAHKTPTFIPNPINTVAGHFEGNGGDHVRATFMKVGQAVLQFLRDTSPGRSIVAVNGLNLDVLSRSLSISEITVVETALKDSTGAAVDATGIPGLITLSKNSWMQHFEKSRDVYYLVFHEMLRSVAYHDDNYVISRALNPFPESRRIVTRIESVVPLIDDDLLSDRVDTDHILISGSGCSRTALGEQADFDLERNLLDISFERYTVATGGTSLKSLDRKACGLAIPIQARPGKRIIVSQLDVSGVVNMAPAASSTLTVEAFQAGSKGTPMRKLISNADSDVPLQGRVLLRKTDVLTSSCGGSAILRLNSSALEQGTSQSGSSLDIDRMTLYFRVEACVGQ